MEIAGAGTFDLLIESIGYLPYTVKGIRIEGNTHKALEKIYLSKKITRLADVIVVAPAESDRNQDR